MIRNWYNQIPYPALKTKREINSRPILRPEISSIPLQVWLSKRQLHVEGFHNFYCALLFSIHNTCVVLLSVSFTIWQYLYCQKKALDENQHADILSWGNIWAAAWHNQEHIRTVWSESSLCALWIAKDQMLLHADSEDWSDCADAQADLSLRWAHSSFCKFPHAVARLKKTVSLLHAVPEWTQCFFSTNGNLI